MGIVENPDCLDSAEIIVGIPSYNEADNINYPTKELFNLSFLASLTSVRHLLLMRSENPFLKLAFSDRDDPT